MAAKSAKEDSQAQEKHSLSEIQGWQQGQLGTGEALTL
jgi:hypothetical protein